MKLIKLFLILAILVLGGCGQQNSITNTPLTEGEKQVKSIQLTCTSVCKELYKDQFETRIYNDEESLALFMETIENAVEIPGILDYVVLYDMVVTFEDETTMNYYLNIEIEKDRKGLLVEASNSSKGYSISSELYNRLSTLIYSDFKS